jgi:hypothetical protein
MGSEWILVLLTALTVIVGLPTFVRQIRPMISASPASGTQSSARSQSHRVIITMIILVLLSCGTVVVGFLRKPEPIFADAVVNAWKYQNGVFELMCVVSLWFNLRTTIIWYCTPSPQYQVPIG